MGLTISGLNTLLPQNFEEKGSLMSDINEEIAKKSEAGFRGFCQATTIGTIGVVIILLLMAAFLL